MRKAKFPNKFYWQNYTSTPKEEILSLSFIPYPKTNQPKTLGYMMHKYLNINTKTIKLVEENIGRKCHDVGHGNSFRPTPTA